MSQSDFVNRGQALVTAGQYQEAVKVCRLGLLGRPTTVEGRIVLGQALLALKRYDEVLAEMRVALELDHSSLNAQVLKGEALLRKGDAAGASEVFARARTQAPTDARVAQLLTEAERAAIKPKLSSSHPAVSFVGNPGAAESHTKHYPNHGADEEDTGDDADVEDTGGGYTRPTSVSTPAANKRSAAAPAMPPPDLTPPPDVLAVGDRSGTVEVDPEADGLEVEGHDDDFGEVAAPPPSRDVPVKVEAPRGAVGGVQGSARSSAGGSPRGSIERSRGPLNPAPRVALPIPTSARPMRRGEVSSVELDDEELVELSETPLPPEKPARRGPGPGPGTAVRNAVKMPSGPIDLPPELQHRPTALGAAVPAPPLAHRIAGQPHELQMNVVPPQPSRSQIAAALPTAAAMPMPAPPLPYSAAAARPTIALNAAQQQSAAAVDALFTGGDPNAMPPSTSPPAWARATMVAGSPNHARAIAAADEPTRRPGEIDPQIAAMAGNPGGQTMTPPAGMFADQGSTPGSKPLKTGMRKTRSRLQVVMWIVIGAVVIGGGVFAGFQIRAVRLRNQIAAARDQAVDLAKADTWLGWSGARDRLAGIAQASATIDNRAALARARAVLAYEFGDGVADAKAAVDKLGGQGGLDGAIARAYIALADNDPKLAKAAADKATDLAASDAAALYVTGQAALLGGDYKTAIASLKSAHEHEPRPLYAVGLARAIAATGAWEDALAAVDRALGAMPDHPAALIERASLLAASGRIAPGVTAATEIRSALVKLIGEGSRPLAEQTRGISPEQVSLANLALCQVDFALRDMSAARADYRAALNVGIDEQRFAEELTDTLRLIGEIDAARVAADKVLTLWPASRRGRIAQAQIALARNNPAEALDVFTKSPDAAILPLGQAVRGQARLATGDVDSAKADFDAALKKLPNLELALVARAWIDLAAGDVDDARKRIEPRFNPNTSSVALTTVYAAVLRATGDAAAREKAKSLLEKVAGGALTPDVARAWLELARVYREAGDLRSARSAYAEAIKTGNVDARLEAGVLQIEDRDPNGGRETLDAVLRDAGPDPSPTMLIETARARMLAGDHAGAEQLLEQASKAPGTLPWKLDRERGRLLLRKGDYPGASQMLLRALEACGNDAETFLVAADVISADAKQSALVAKLKALVGQRLKGVPEGDIVIGKLALAANNDAEADAAYTAAKKQLEAISASPRRLAQAHFGIAVIAYNRGDDPQAMSELEYVQLQDPSIYTAYLFAAELVRQKKGPGATALALSHASKAVAYNPDLLDGWVMVGTLAAKAGNTKMLTDAITHVGALAPGSDKLKELQALAR